MKYLKTILFVIFVLTQIIFPRQITFNEAQIVAENWTEILEENFGDQVRIFNGREIYRENIIVAYVFDLYPKGFIIIAPRDYLPPIKMYSTKNNFEEPAGPLEDVIFKNNLTIIKDVDKKILSPERHFSIKNRKVFNYLLNRNIDHDTLSSLKEETTEEAGPLLSTTWDQGAPYNMYVPNTFSGCNATSLAQIFNYYEWPDRGVGSETYYDPASGKTLTANFDKEYEWWNMLDDYGFSRDPEENKHAVAILMYDVGVAIHTGYLWDGSAAAIYRHRQNLIDHFKYSADMTEPYRGFFTYDEWFNIAKEQIDNGWPCEYGLSSHSAVMDGYRIAAGVKTVHINFGWGGKYNGYYSTDNIKPSEDIDFTKYNDSDTMIINIYPYSSYKRPVGLPPETITVNGYENRSLFLKEYIVKINWSESPSRDKRLEGYIIYRQKDGETEEVDRVSPGTKSYEIRIKDLTKYKYSVGVIDKNGAISDIPEFITPVLN